MRFYGLVVEGIARHEMEMRVRDDLSCAGAVVLHDVVVGFAVGDVGHGGCDEGAGEEGEEAADLGGGV